MSYRLPFALAVLGLLSVLACTREVAAKKLDADTLLSSGRLIDVRIELPPKDWAALCRQAPNGSVFFSGSPQTSSYTYFRGDIWIDDVKIPGVGIRKKGFFGSNDNQRPSLKIKFDEYEEQDPIKGLSRLTLNNNKQDKSLTSQMLTYQLFRDAGIAAPRCNLARVTVNGNYLGVYSNVESIKKPFLKHAFGSSKGKLFEGQLTDFHPGAVQNLEAKNKAAEKDRSEIKQLADLLAAEGPLDMEKLGQLIDLDKFFRYWAIESLTGFWDGYAANQNNYYFYIHPETGKGQFIPWGADWVFTTGGPFSRRGPGRGAAPVNTVYAQSILANRLYHAPGAPQRYEAAMKQILSEVWDEDQMVQKIEQTRKLVADHLHPSQRGAPKAMEDTQAFITSRKKAMLDQLARGPARISRAPRLPSHQVETGAASGAFETTWAETGKQPPTGTSQMKLTLSGKPVTLTDVTATARPFTFPRFFPGGARPGNSKPPVILTLTASREGAAPVTISLTIDQKDFVAGKELADVSGRYQETPAAPSRRTGGGRPSFGGPGFGGPGFGRGPNRVVSGRLKLTSAGIEPGDKIAGEFNLKVKETRGGMFGGGGFPRR